MLMSSKHCSLSLVRLVLGLQGSVILFECYILGNMMFWPQVSYYQYSLKKKSCFKFKCKIVIDIHNEDTCV